MQWFDLGRSRGASHIVVDPRATPTARGSAVHLQPVPGTDIALANALLYIALREGYVDEDYVSRRTTGFDEVRRTVGAYWPDRVERVTGVPVHQLRETARLLGTAPAAMILTARGPEQQRTGTDAAQAFLNLALALGLPGKPFSGYGTITGQGNGQGGREHGLKADQLPGYRKLDDPVARSHVAAVWGIDPDVLPAPGRSVFEMLDAMGTDGGVRTLRVFASNIAVSAPDSNRVARRLGALDLLVVSDIFMSETAAVADVVLPTSQWAEEEGTITNLEGRVLHRRRALSPPVGVRTDLQVLLAVATRLGRGKYFSDDPREVFDELRLASAGGKADYAGITYERIDAEQGVFWPCPSLDSPGTPRLFADRFATDDGRARFFRTTQTALAELPDADYPYYLTTGRVMVHYQSGAQTRRVKSLTLTEPDAFVQLHPDLAAAHSIRSTELVELRTRRGSALFRAPLSDGMRPDTLFTPCHWGGRSGANRLTNAALDPTSRMPEFKVCAVAISRAPDQDADLSLLPAGLGTGTSP